MSRANLSLEQQKIKKIIFSRGDFFLKFSLKIKETETITAHLNPDFLKKINYFQRESFGSTFFIIGRVTIFYAL
jgi:hypothetical protein